MMKMVFDMERIDDLITTRVAFLMDIPHVTIAINVLHCFIIVVHDDLYMVTNNDLKENNTILIHLTFFIYHVFTPTTSYSCLPFPMLRSLSVKYSDNIHITIRHYHNESNHKTLSQ